MRRLTTTIFGSALMTVSALSAETNKVDFAARECLKLYAKGDIKALVKVSKQGGTFESRLFAAYLLFRSDPGQYRSHFIQALPRNEKQYIAYASIPSNLVVDEGVETYELSMKGVPWPISFWEIHKVACAMARQGNRISIRSVLALSRFGDGEIGEGMSEDARRLFDTPAIVAKHWDLFQSHIDSLSCMREDFSPSQVEKIKHGYIVAFSKDQATLKRILELIEKGER